MATFNVNESDFETQVLQNNLPVLVDFWATWCGPCKLAEPVLEELSETFTNKVLIAKLDVDVNPAIAQKYGVLSIPTTILFKSGQEIGRQVGFSGKAAFENLLNKAV